MGSTVTSSRRYTRVSRILGNVIRFMCGHRLHGRTISTSGSSAWTLSAIEHSVIITNRLGCLSRIQLIMCAVEPVKSASATPAGRALRMGDDLQRRVGLAEASQFIAGEAFVDLA